MTTTTERTKTGLGYRITVKETPAERERRQAERRKRFNEKSASMVVEAGKIRLIASGQ